MATCMKELKSTQIDSPSIKNLIKTENTCLRITNGLPVSQRGKSDIANFCGIC